VDRYHIALFIHLLALIVAAGATATTKLAAGRLTRAKTVGDALDWHRVLSSASKLFPLCTAALVLTGAYMVSFSNASAWRSGFVVAGLMGVILLLAIGGFLGARGKAVEQHLEELAAQGADQPAPKFVPPPLVAALPTVNTGIALSVAFDMVTKPSIPVALGIVAIGIVLGAAASFRQRSAVIPDASGASVGPALHAN
jgi:hypothetical protein